MSANKIRNIRFQYDDTDAKIIERVYSGILRFQPLSDRELEQQRIENSARFASQFKDNIFQDEYAILYELVVKRKLTTGDWASMEAVIDECKDIILNSPQVYLGKSGDDFICSDAYNDYVQMTKQVYERICSAPFNSSEGFRSACNTFIAIFEKKHLRQTYAYMTSIISSSAPYIDTRGGKNKTYQGVEGSSDLYSTEMTSVRELKEAQSTRQILLGQEWLNTQTDERMAAEEAKRTELLCTLGIPEIDDVWAGLRRTRFINLIGPPKGGKTTLAGFMAQRLLQEGRSVAIWVMEGSAQESWINKFIVAHCYKNGVKINAQDLQDGLHAILDGNANRKVQQAVKSALEELARGENLSFIQESGYAESFLEVIEHHHRVYNRFDAIIIDSLVNLQSKEGRIKSEYLSKAYMNLKDYVAHRLDPAPVCITTAQFKQSAIKEARNSNDIYFDETSGGETAETIRTPDEVLGIFGTPAQLDVGMTTLYHIASRHSKHFEPFDVRVQFDQAQFISAKGEK